MQSENRVSNIQVIGKALILLAISILLLRTQIRIVRTLFPNTKQKQTFFRYTIAMGGVVAGLLILYSYKIETILGAPSSWWYSLFVCVSGILLSLFFAYKKKRWGAFIAATSTILAIITGGVERLLAGGGIGLIILKATGEEILKTSAAQSLAAHTHVSNNTATTQPQKQGISLPLASDGIIMSILAGLGFALFENIVYFTQNSSFGQFLIRSVTTSLLHAIFTGTIGYLLWKYSKHSYLGYIYAYCIGIFLHTLYNTTMSYIPLIGGIVFILSGYFFLTYLLYKTDRLYL